MAYVATHHEVGGAACALCHLVLVAGRDADEFGMLLVARCALEFEHQRVVLVSRRQARDVGELRLELQGETLSTETIPNTCQYEQVAWAGEQGVILTGIL